MALGELPELGVILLLGVSSVFWLGTVAIIASREPIADGRRTSWLIFVVLTHWIGAALYWLRALVGRTTRRAGR